MRKQRHQVLQVGERESSRTSHTNMCSALIEAPALVSFLGLFSACSLQNYGTHKNDLIRDINVDVKHETVCHLAIVATKHCL